MLNTDTNKTYL